MGENPTSDNDVESRRTTRRVSGGVEQTEKLQGNEQQTAHEKERAVKVEVEQPEMCDGISVLMDKNLIPSASTGEPKLLYYHV